MSDRGHDQVVVVAVRGGLLGRVGEMLLCWRRMGMMMGGRQMKLHMGERVSDGALLLNGPSGRREAQRG